MHHRDRAIMTYLLDEVWALSEGVFTRLVEIVDRHTGGEKLTDAEIASIVEIRTKKADDAAAPQPPEAYHLAGTTAVIPIRGVIAKHANQVNDVSQPTGTSVETIAADLARALADPAARDILLKIESPGGSVAGIANLAEAIREASAQKTVTAYADDSATSAAYWLGSAAQRFYASRTAAVGSIGVYSVLADTSRQAEADGVELKIIRSGRYKGVGEPGMPIEDDDLAALQDRVDQIHDVFVREVASGRGMTIAAVAALADGRTFTAGQAKANGLIDSVKTLPQALAVKKPRPRTAADLSATAHAANAAANGKESDMPAEPDAAHAAQEQHEKQMAAARAEAATAERTRIQAIHAAIGGEALQAVREKAVADGLDVDAAKALAFDALAEAHTQAIAAKDAEIAEAAKRLEAITAGAPDGLRAADPADAAEEPAAAAASANDDGNPDTYAAAVLAAQEDGKLTRSQAHRLVAPRFPKSFAAWNARQN